MPPGPLLPTSYWLQASTTTTATTRPPHPAGAAPWPRGHSAHVEARWPPHSTLAGESLTILGFGPIRMGVSVGHLPSADHVQRLPYIGSSQNALSFSLYERHPPGTSTINSSHFEGLPRIDASRKSTRSSGGRHVGAAFCPIARGLGQSPTGDQEHCLPLVGSSQNRLSFTLYVRHPPSTPAFHSHLLLLLLLSALLFQLPYSPTSLLLFLELYCLMLSVLSLLLILYR